ncbi:putative pentatricopeptide repeat-containing protein At3g05240 [Selaginella moellendorffii]|nr:putative pentatricopeptide repeat-containing protein At3g05240 [Selaginella moellendorffii]|eukprot:XP_002979596.2 putative pentatricopeptide repeat-containing protein At3g05240 [Selaginella moellendorffii]
MKLHWPSSKRGYTATINAVQETLAALDNGSISGSPVLYSDLLRGCGTLADARRIRQYATRDNVLDHHPSLARHIVQTFVRLGSMADAQDSFAATTKKTGVVIWTAMITGYAKHGDFSRAIQFFAEMERNHVLPDKITYVAVLGAIQDLEQGRRIHVRIQETGYDTDLVVANALMKMYAACSSLADATRVFEAMDHRDVVSWTSIIAANARAGDFPAAMGLFRRMQLQGTRPNRITLLELLAWCDDPGEGAAIHERAFASGLRSDVPVCNAILNMHAKAGRFETASELFERMPVRNAVSWTAMMAAMVRAGRHDDALRLFRDMEDDGVEPDSIAFITVINACSSAATARWIHGCIIRGGCDSDTAVSNAIIRAYARCGSLKEAYRTFVEIKERRDHVSWTTMISAFAEFGRIKRCVQLFREMLLEGVRANEVTLITVVNACAGASAIKEGRWVHDCVIGYQLERSSSMVATALLDMYGKCGSLEVAARIFGELEQPDVVSWTSIIAATAQNGDGSSAARLFCAMQLEGVRPVDVTFVSVVAACSHAGMVDLGKEFVTRLRKDHREGIELTLEHCGCIVDLLARAGRLEEAECVIDSMPFKPTPAVWMAFLAGCKTYEDISRGQRAAAQILGLDEKTTAAVIALSSTYAASDRRGDGEALRGLMADGCLKEEHGIGIQDGGG